MLFPRQVLIRHSVFFAIVLSCWQPKNLAVKAKDFNVIEKLHVKLLDHYNKQIRPVINHTQTLSVSASMTLTSFDFDEFQSRFSARGFFFMSWRDPRLSWSPTEYDGLETIHLSNEKIWIPDLEVYNTPGVLSVDRTFASTDVLINYDGTIYFVPLCNLMSVCISDPTLYPFDSVTCSIKIGSWTHNALKMSFYPKNNETKVNIDDLVSPRMSQWSLVETSVTVDVKTYDCCPEPYQSLMLSFKILRSLSTSSAIITPTLVIMVLTLVTFLIPPADGTKVTVGVANLIILCAYLLFFYSALPSGSFSTPLIVSFYNGSLVMVIISITISIFSLRFVRGRGSVPPAFVQNCLASRIGLLLGVPQQDTINRLKTNDALEKKFQQSSEIRDVELQQQWTNLFLALDRIMLVIYSVVFSVFLKCYLA